MTEFGGECMPASETSQLRIRFRTMFRVEQRHERSRGQSLQNEPCRRHLRSAALGIAIDSARSSTRKDCCPNGLSTGGSGDSHVRLVLHSKTDGRDLDSPDLPEDWRTCATVRRRRAAAPDNTMRSLPHWRSRSAQINHRRRTHALEKTRRSRVGLRSLRQHVLESEAAAALPCEHSVCARRFAGRRQNSDQVGR
jgi:hypothetical protein